MTKTETTGILTVHLRESLKKKKIPSNTKLNEFDSNKGRIRSKIIELPWDFESISSSPHCWKLLSDNGVRTSLFHLHDVLSKILKYHPVPLKRITCIRKENERIFKIDQVKLLYNQSIEEDYIISNFSEDDTNLSDNQDKLEELRYNFHLDKIKEGSNLRANEWNIILKHYQKYKNRNPFYMPLIEGKEYSWLEIKKELKHNKISKILKTESNEDKKYAEMWKIINTLSGKFDKKQSKMINRDIDKIDQKIKRYGFQLDREWYPNRRVKKIA